MSILQGSSLRWLSERLQHTRFRLQPHGSTTGIQTLYSRATWRISLLTFTVLVFLITLYWNATSDGPTSLIRNGNKAQVVELEGLSIGEPFTTETTTSNKHHSAERLIDALKLRLNQSAVDAGSHVPEYQSCSIKPNRYEGTAVRLSHVSLSKRRNAVVAIAINLHDSESIIPAQAIAILEASAYLLTKNKVYLSIYENGSKDQTRALLSDFAAAAQRLGIDGIFVTSSRMQTSEDQDRILMLSEIRNHALSPLIPHLPSQTAATLIFINDVVTCPSDILELVHQQRLQGADMVTGLDWGAVNRESGLQHAHARLYDMWVARGINGDLFYKFAETHGYNPITEHQDWVHDTLITQSPEIHQRWLDGRPLPVYSGWGGMAAFNAALFTSKHLRFRSSVKSGWSGGSSIGALGDWGKLVGTDGYLDSDCPGASECEYICRDIWNLRRGQARIMLAPQVRTTYSVDDWNALVAQVPPTRRDEYDHLGDMINWYEVNIPSSVDCIATRTSDGDYIHTWDEKNERYRLDPYWSFS